MKRTSWAAVGMAWALMAFALALAGAGEAIGAEPPKDVKLPADVKVAIYLPTQFRRYQGVVQGTFQAGQTLEDTVLSAGQDYFSESHMAEAGADAPFGLLLSLHPDVKKESDHILFTMDYAVYGADDKPLQDGTESVKIDRFDPSKGDPIAVATAEAVQRVMASAINSLHPDSAKYPAVLSLKSRTLEFAAKKDKPRGNGTGFYINANGQVLTAAHVVQDCVKTDVKRDDKVMPAKVIARSNVIDIAVLDTGAAATAFLPFRRSLDYELGEAITNVGYPLQNILSQSPNLTRGNISAKGGLTGSVGQMQFSAPVQPGSSGGPVVSDGGEVLGVTVGTLSVAALVRQGVIPQNVNFALESRYAARFLQKNKLEFTSVEPNAHGDAHTANQAALAAVVNVQCYE